MISEIPWDYEKDQMVRSPGAYPYWVSPYHISQGDKPRFSMRPVFSFEADLILTTMYWSNSSCVVFETGTGTEYYMFIKEFEDMLLAGATISGKKVSGLWTFVKRGTKYGIKYLGERDGED